MKVLWIYIFRQGLLLSFCLIVLYAYLYEDTFFLRFSRFSVVFIGIAFGQIVGCLRLMWPQHFPQIKKWIFLTLIFSLVILALVHPELPRRFEYRSSLRLQGVFSSPNYFGVLMGVGFLITVAFLVKFLTLSRSRFRLQKVGICLLVLSSCVTGVMLLGSYSRGALAGTLIGFLYLFVVLRRYREQFGIPTKFARRFLRAVTELRYFITWLLGSSTLVVFWAFRYTEVPVIRRIFSVFNWNDFSIRNRGLEYLGELQILANHIWSGVGFGQTMNMYDGYYRNPILSEIPGAPSNGWLDLAISVGLLGLLVFIAIIGLSFWSKSMDDKSLSTDHFDVILVRAVIVVLLVSSFFSGNFFFWPASLILWTFLEFAWQSEITDFDKRKRIQVRSENKAVDDNLT